MTELAKKAICIFEFDIKCGGTSASQDFCHLNSASGKKW